MGPSQNPAPRELPSPSRGGEWLQGHLMRLRAQLIVRASALAAVREDLAALDAAEPGLPARAALVRQAEALQQRVAELERACQRWKACAESDARLSGATSGCRHCSSTTPFHPYASFCVCRCS